MEKRLTMFLACFFLSIGMALAQTRITGTVVSAEDNEPVIGASVKVVGTNTGVATDVDGKFTIVINHGAKLEVSYLGMKTQVVAAKDGMKVVLESSSVSLDNVVVTGYGTAKKLGSIAGSVTSVSSDKFANRPVANIGDALQGQVAGVQVFTSSGEPTAGTTIRLRGVTSINASTTPLFILDGSQITATTFKSINPDDIETMTVLKDASATAIYGSRAANGVVILTSKRGKFGQAPNITVTAQYGVSKSTGDRVDMMNAEQWLSLQEMISPNLKDNASFQAEKNYYIKNGISTKWSDYFFGKSAPTSQINASVTGGSNNTSYLLSYNHYTADGIMDDSNMRRESMRVNLETNIASWIKVGANSNLSYTKYGTTAFGGSSNSIYNKVYASRTYLPIESPYEIKGLDRTNYAGSTFEGYGAEKDYFDLLDYYNPYYLSRIQPTTRNMLNLTENVFINLSPVKGLNIRSAVGLELLDYRYSYKALPVGPFEGAGSGVERFERMYRWTVTNTAEYKFAIANQHHFTFLVGEENSNDKDETFDSNVEGLTDTRLLLLSAGAKATLPGHSIVKTVRNSWFGTASYDFADKYFVDLSVRRDGSSLFGENNKWATFGAAAFMWSVSKENFMASTRSWLDDLNLKVSYGTTGNSGIDAYLALGLVGSGPLYNGAKGTAVANPSNPDLTWESVKTFNLALTGRLFHRLGFDVEFYNKTTANMLMDIPYSFSTGFSSGKGNVANMFNRGVDVTLDANIINTKDWRWNASLNFNYNKNEITKLFQGRDSYVLGTTGLRLQEGHPYGEFYSVRWYGVDPRDGQNIWLDKNGNKTKVYSEGDQVMTGKTQYAPWSGGFNTSLAWRGIQLDMQFTGMFGRYITNNERYFSENARFASGSNQTVNMLNMWTKPGQITDIPAADADIEFDSHLIENASFVRLKMIQLSYSLQPSLLRSIGVIKSAKIFLVGRNLLTFTGFNGYDPEVDSNISLGNYPNTKQYSVGLQVTF